MQRTRTVGLRPTLTSTANLYSEAKRIGSIVADMTSLLEHPDIIKTAVDAKTGKERRFYEIQMDLVMIVEDRNLRFEAHWPKGSGQKVAEGQVSLAFAFEPGTV